MAKSNTKKKPTWLKESMLKNQLTRQNRSLQSSNNRSGFNPHQYFGGWNDAERSSIDMIHMDNRLKEMMDYETSNSSISVSYSQADFTESLETPSVAEELEPSSPIHKSSKVFDFKMQSVEHQGSIYIVSESKRPQTKTQHHKPKDYVTPDKNNFKSILLKTKKYLEK